MTLLRVDEKGDKWYPISVDFIAGMLIANIKDSESYEYAYQLRRNIAYNMQYIELQNKIIREIQLTSVLYTQTIKTIVLTGCSIIESLLHYILIINNKHSTTDWEEVTTLGGGCKKVNGELIKVDTIISKKMESSKLKHMTFDSMIKKAEKYKLFGDNIAIYQKLSALRKLRNKVHLQEIKGKADTDYFNFNYSDLENINNVLYTIFTSDLFKLEEIQKNRFNYLKIN